MERGPVKSVLSSPWLGQVHPGTPGTPWYTGYTWVQPGTPGTLTLVPSALTPCRSLNHPSVLGRTKNVPNGWYRLLLFPDSLLCSLPCFVHSLHPCMECTYQALLTWCGTYILHTLWYVESLTLSHPASKQCASCGTERSVPEACLALHMLHLASSVQLVPQLVVCLLYTSPSPRDVEESR